MENKIRLDNWIVIKLSGPERMEYLNGIIPNDLNFSDMVRSVILNSKAKIQVIFWIKQIDDYFILYTTEKMKDKLISQLLTYKLSMNVKLEDITDEIAPTFLVPNDKYLNGIGYYTIENTDDKSMNNSKFLDALFQSKEAPPELMIGENPFEVGMSDAINLKKGCFLGQEPLSRMINIGKPRSFLYFIELNEFNPDMKNEDVFNGNIFYHLNNTLITQCKSSVSDFTNLINKYDIKSICKIGKYPEFNRI